MYNSFLTMHDYYAIPFLSSRLLFFDIGVHLLSDGKRRDGSFRPHSIISLSSHLVIRPPQPQHIAKSLYLVIIQVGGRKMPENPVNYEETPTQYTRTRAHLDPGASPVRRDGSVGFFFSFSFPFGCGWSWALGNIDEIQKWLHNGEHGRSGTPKTNGGGGLRKTVAVRGKTAEPRK